MPRPRSFALHRYGQQLVAVDDRGVRLQIAGADYLVRRETLPQRVKRGVGFVLGWLGRLLYLSPLIWLASVLTSPPIDGYLLVGFVTTAVAFFAVLNVYVVTSVVAWLSGNDPNLELDPPHRRPAPTTTQALPAPEARKAPLPPGSILSVTGRVVSLGSAEHPVAVDCWSTGEVPLRLTEARPFAVHREGRMPVVLTMTRPPDIHAAPTQQTLGEAMRAVTPQSQAFFQRLPLGADANTPVETVTLRPGDEVRVTGVVVEVVDDVTRIVVDGSELGLSDERDGAPYREGERQRGLVVGANLGTTLIIERL